LRAAWAALALRTVQTVGTISTSHACQPDLAARAVFAVLAINPCRANIPLLALGSGVAALALVALWPLLALVAALALVAFGPLLPNRAGRHHTGVG
jgi:hypothetical protein